MAEQLRNTTYSGGERPFWVSKKPKLNTKSRTALRSQKSRTALRSQKSRTALRSQRVRNTVHRRAGPSGASTSNAPQNSLETVYRHYLERYNLPLPTDREVHAPIDLSKKRLNRRIKNINDQKKRCHTCFGHWGLCAAKNMPCGHITNCKECIGHMKLCNICHQGILSYDYLNMPDIRLDFFTQYCRGL